MVRNDNAARTGNFLRVEKYDKLCLKQTLVKEYSSMRRGLNEQVQLITYKFCRKTELFSNFPRWLLSRTVVTATHSTLESSPNELRLL
jgi:hypothetical protein